MYFPLFEPYLLEDLTIENTDINTDTNNTNDVCIICLEPNDIIKIKKKYEKYNHCECNYYIHSDCLEQWKNIKNKCPICHSIFPEKEQEQEEEYVEEDEEQYRECYYLNFLKFIFEDYEFNHRNICLLMIRCCVKSIILVALFTNVLFLVLIFNFIFYFL